LNPPDSCAAQRTQSVSLTSTRLSDPSHLFGLAGPISSRLNRMDLPCSRCFLWLHAGGTNPGSTSGRSRCRGLRFRLPLCGIGSATPITIDFAPIFPFTVIPAYNLPVYASQRPLDELYQRFSEVLEQRATREWLDLLPEKEMPRGVSHDSVLDRRSAKI
jgi:hypothetical protein